MEKRGKTRARFNCNSRTPFIHCINYLKSVVESGVGDGHVDPHPVTVSDFRRFVKATGHVTVAERAPAAGDYPDADPGQLVPGSLVFQRPNGPVDLTDYRAWWAYVPGANWRRPEGGASDVYSRGRHPVTHVAYADAEAYADRAYQPNGLLVQRQMPGAVLHDKTAIAGRAVQLAEAGEIVSVDGGVIKTTARSLCIHGNTPGAVAIARAVRSGLFLAGVEIRAAL